MGWARSLPTRGNSICCGCGGPTQERVQGPRVSLATGSLVRGSVSKTQTEYCRKVTGSPWLQGGHRVCYCEEAPRVGGACRVVLGSGDGAGPWTEV